MLTEQRNPRTLDIDQLSTFDVLRLINQEDATIAHSVEKVLPEIAAAVTEISDRLRQGGRLVYVGAGTSGRIAAMDAAECAPTFGVPHDLVQAVMAGGAEALSRSGEGAEDNVEAARADMERLGLTFRDVVVGLAASGRTPYVLTALDIAKANGSLTVGIACSGPSPLLELADISIHAAVGPEVIAGSTRMKAGTAQKVILNMLSTAVMIELGKVYSNLMVDVRISNAKLLQRAKRIVSEVAHVDAQKATELLCLSNNEVKTAIVMSICAVTAEEARDRLQSAGGRLRNVVG